MGGVVKSSVINGWTSDWSLLHTAVLPSAKAWRLIPNKHEKRIGTGGRHLRSRPKTNNEVNVGKA